MVLPFRLLVPSITIAWTSFACSQPIEEHPDIPPPGVFAQTLRHDLETYFAPGEPVPITVTYELLRDQATITGIAFPKYYAWVTVLSEERVLRVGAVRLEASHRSFQVTDFVPADYINRDTAYIRSVFPAPLLSDIRTRARNAPRTPRRGA